MKISKNSLLEITRSLLRALNENLNFSPKKDVVFKNENLFVAIPQTTNSAVFWGSRTSWDISTPETNNKFIYKTLNSDDDIFFVIIVNNDKGRKLLLKITKNGLVESEIFLDDGDKVSYEELEEFLGKDFESVFDSIFESIHDMGGVPPFKKFLIDFSTRQTGYVIDPLKREVSENLQLILNSFRNIVDGVPVETSSHAIKNITEIYQMSIIVNFMFKLKDVTGEAIHQVYFDALPESLKIEMAKHPKTKYQTIRKMLVLEKRSATKAQYYAALQNPSLSYRERDELKAFKTRFSRNYKQPEMQLQDRNLDFLSPEAIAPYREQIPDKEFERKEKWFDSWQKRVKDRMYRQHYLQQISSQ